MILLLLVITLVLLLLLKQPQPQHEYLKSNITVYSGNETSTGINPDSYPFTVSIPGVGKQKVYPVAIHDDDYQKDKCKIFKVTTKKGKVFYAHAINRCNKKHPNCKNRYKNGSQYLIDLYYKKDQDYKNRGLKYDINKGSVDSTNHKVSALDLNTKHWHGWLTKNHVLQKNGYTCRDCC